MSRDGSPVSIVVDGAVVPIRALRQRWLLADELDHGGVAGEAWEAILEDGSLWWIVRDLHAKARWLGEPM